MSTKAFILSLLALLILAGSYVVWMEKSSPTPDSDPTSSTHPTSTDSDKKKNQPPSRTPKTRFSGLLDSSASWQTRVDMLKRIESKELKNKDVDELFQLLKHRPQANKKESWYVVANEIMEQMRRKGVGAEKYSDALMAIIHDPAQDKVIRDYAIQHLSIWLAPRGSNNRYEENKAKINAGIQTLTKVISDPSIQTSSIPGTALMGLVDLHQIQPESKLITESFDTLQPWLTAVISGQQNSSLITQTSAINAVAMMGRTEYLPAIRNIMNTEASNDSLKLSSIAALGYLAEDSDIETLKTIANSNTKFKHAAQSALNKISNR